MCSTIVPSHRMHAPIYHPYEPLANCTCTPTGSPKQGCAAVVLSCSDLYFIGKRCNCAHVSACAHSKSQEVGGDTTLPCWQRVEHTRHTRDAHTPDNRYITIGVAAHCLTGQGKNSSQDWLHAPACNYSAYPPWSTPPLPSRNEGGPLPNLATMIRQLTRAPQRGNPHSVQKHPTCPRGSPKQPLPASRSTN